MLWFQFFWFIGLAFFAPPGMQKIVADSGSSILRRSLTALRDALRPASRKGGPDAAQKEEAARSGDDTYLLPAIRDVLRKFRFSCT